MERSQMKSRIAKNAKPVRWWEVALLTIGVTLLSRLATGSPPGKNQDYYEQKTRQPAWAPPGWVFAPAWTINNVFLLYALVKLFRSKKDMPERKKLLVLQALIWGIFLSFGFVYFRKRNTVLGAVWTVADAGLAVLSFVTARKYDKRFAGNYLPLLLWTGFASTVIIPQAIPHDGVLPNAGALLNGAAKKY